MMVGESQETIIRLANDEAIATVYTENPVLWQRLKSLADPSKVYRQKGRVYAREFSLPVDSITIGGEMI